jgi:Fe-S-cluster containining protein
VKKEKITRNKSKKRREKIRKEIVEYNIFSQIKEYGQFKKLKEEILKDRECEKCGICCNSYKIRITKEDIDREPKLIENSVLLTERIRKRHKLGNKEKYIRVIKTTSEDNLRCVFYDDKIGCKIHSTKPEECVQYTPSLSHCKYSELKEYFDLRSYYNLHQKLFVSNIKNCSPQEKIEQTRKLLQILIIPFVSKFYKIGDNIHMKLDKEKPIPLFIKECLNLDNNYKFIKDLPLVENYNETIVERGV